MGRDIEPRLTVESATDEQQRALEPFLNFVYESPSTVIDALRLYTAGESHSSIEPIRKVLGAIGLVLKTKVDLEIQPDPETARAMRNAITDVTPEDRRLVRLTTLVMEVQSWQKEHPIEKQPVLEEQQNNTSAA